MTVATTGRGSNCSEQSVNEQVRDGRLTLTLLTGAQLTASFVLFTAMKTSSHFNVYTWLQALWIRDNHNLLQQFFFLLLWLL